MQHIGNSHSSGIELEEMETAKVIVDRVLEDSIVDLEKEDKTGDMFVRWELGACWVQHLQTQAAAEKVDKKSMDSSNKEIKGEDKKNATVFEDKKPGIAEQPQIEFVQLRVDDDVTTSNELNDDNSELRGLLSEAAYARLKDTETSLHSKVRL